MKNLKVNMTALALAGTLLLTGTGFDGQVHAVNDSKVVAQAQIKNDQITVSEGVNIYVDNVPYQPKDAAGNNVEPFIYNGTTYLPARAIANIYGANISWDGKTNSVYIGKTGEKKLNVTPKMEDTPLRNATIPVSTDVKIYVEGENGTYQRFIPMDASGKEVPVIISNGTTYLPARAISNIYGTNIAWDGKNSRVYIGEQFVVENPEQYNEYQLEALPMIDTMDRQWATIKIMEEQFERNFEYANEINLKLNRLVENAPTAEAKTEYQAIFDDFNDNCGKIYSFLFSKNRYLDLDDYLEEYKRTFDDLDEQNEFLYIKYCVHDFNTYVSRHGVYYEATTDEKIIDLILYVEREFEKLGLKLNWNSCKRFPGLEEAREAKVKILEYTTNN